MRSVPLRLYGLALLSAALQLVPFPIAGPVPCWRRVFCWFCLVPLLVALLGRNRKEQPLTWLQSSAVGYVCGVAWFGGNCYWIYQTMFLYGGLPAPVAFGILILFSLYLGLYFALFGACFALIRRWTSPTSALLLSPLLWVAVELARARITGFPWDLLGYAQVDNLFLTRLASLTGVMGLSLVIAVANALWIFQPKIRMERRKWVGPVCAALLMAASYLGTLRAVPASQTSALATLLQDNLRVGTQAARTPQSQPAMLEDFAQQTFHPQISPAAAELSSQSGAAAAPTQLVLWPEAPTDFMSADPGFRQAMGSIARSAHAPVVADAVAVGDKANARHSYDEFVSASFFLPDGSFAGRYDKMHLVPFGEYTPYKQLFFFAGHLLDGLNFVPGTRRTLFNAGGHRYGVFICYESIFGDEIRHFALNGAQVLVNLSDDGWYGDTSAPWEHLDMARMRAIENGRWVLRDTNTGLTASIDPYGRIVAQMPRHIRGAVEVPFDYRDGLTFYTRHGDWIGWLCSLAVLAVILGSYMRRRWFAEAAQTQVN